MRQSSLGFPTRRPRGFWRCYAQRLERELMDARCEIMRLHGLDYERDRREGRAMAASVPR